MDNKSYRLRYLPLFEQDLINIANYIKNVLKNETAALSLVDDVEAAILANSQTDFNLLDRSPFGSPLP